MVGGIIEAIAEQEDCVRVTVIGTGCEKKDICRVLVKEKEVAIMLFRPGDDLWWQSGQVYWTPAKDRITYKAPGFFDVPFTKLGYSF